ncbi:MAG: hypothetical protein R3E50_06940 [Halioglobus sp.]
MAGDPATRLNDAHVALAQLEQRGQVAPLITQAPDGLHQRAVGSRNVAGRPARPG